MGGVLYHLPKGKPMKPGRFVGDDTKPKRAATPPPETTTKGPKPQDSESVAECAALVGQHLDNLQGALDSARDLLAKMAENEAIFVRGLLRHSATIQTENCRLAEILRQYQG